ncbi:hypothetical protein ACIOKD_40760 [Streptomyces sp. NPDC087844]|uniref:hypothetical protein n=1 Tax=Streptomyces sp. NPDC087844 TaxID=3365805 RepID=UPI003815F9B1
MRTDAPFWDSLVFDGIDDVDVEAVARGRAAGAAARTGPGPAGWTHPYKPYLERRSEEGRISVTRLHSELVAGHVPVTYATVRAHIATMRGLLPGHSHGHRRCGR